jgi:hypothetical protein
MLPLGGLHGKHAVQRGIWVPTQHLLWDKGKPRKPLIELAGSRTFRMQLTSSQQSSIKSANPNISCYCIFLFCCFFFFLSFFSFFSQQVTYFVFNYLYVHIMWISNKPYKTLMEGIKAYVNKQAYKHTYICTRLYSWIQQIK